MKIRVNVSHGETVDFTMIGLEEILEEVEFLYRNHHEVQLRTTMDMTLIPFMLESAEMGFIVEGRPIDKNDYLNANSVAVIHHQFARIRNLSIGDTITVKIPQIQNARDGFVFGYGDGNLFPDVHVESIRQDEGMHKIELEIVGVYNLFRRRGGDSSTFLSTYVYIPDSILPDGVVTTSRRWENFEAEVFLPVPWYSFTLSSTRYEAEFVAENRQPLEEMGFTLTIIESSAENFWESANIILQSIWFNGIVFSIVLGLVLLLVIFLFLRQRRKEFAVSRILGHSRNWSIREIMSTAMLFLIPITVGSVLAWIFARRTVVNTLQTLEAAQVDYEAELSAELSVGYEVYETTFSLSQYWLIGLIAVVFILTMIMVLIGAMKMTRRPVLALLQGKG